MIGRSSVQHYRNRVSTTVLPLRLQSRASGKRRRTPTVEDGNNNDKSATRPYTAWRTKPVARAQPNLAHEAVVHFSRWNSLFSNLVAKCHFS